MFTKSADDLPADFGKVDETNPATKFMLMAERAFKARDEALAEIDRLKSDNERLAKRQEEFIRSADGKETSHVDSEAVILNLIRENNRREAEIERLKAALIAVENCDNKHDLTPYDYMHGNDEVHAVMKLVRETLGTGEQQTEPK